MVKDSVERQYSTTRAIPFTRNTVDDAVLLYRMSRKSNERKPYPRNWPQGARMPEDFINIQQKLMDAGYPLPIMVLSQGYDIENKMPSTQFFKVKATAQGQQKFRYVNTFSNMNSLVDFASRRSGTVAVWVPIIFNQQEATNDLEF